MLVLSGDGMGLEGLWEGRLTVAQVCRHSLMDLSMEGTGMLGAYLPGHCCMGGKEKFFLN